MIENVLILWIYVKKMSRIAYTNRLDIVSYATKITENNLKLKSLAYEA